MVIEKIMPAGYYTPGLLGAQADLVCTCMYMYPSFVSLYILHVVTQGVVKKLVGDKLPRLNAHLQEYFIDVTLVTFNWFLTLFIDALPTEVSANVCNLSSIQP